jgi:hypothetical protein
MSTNIKTLIESISSGKNAEAKEVFESVIAERAYTYLQEYKKTLSASIFSNNTNTKEETATTE